jgi:hypothetical protein
MYDALISSPPGCGENIASYRRTADPRNYSYKATPVYDWEARMPGECKRGLSDGYEIGAAPKSGNNREERAGSERLRWGWERTADFCGWSGKSGVLWPWTRLTLWS